MRRDHTLLHGFLPAHRVKMKGCVRSFFFRKRDPARTLAGRPHPASNAQRSSGRCDPIMALERRSPACSRHHGRTLVVTIPMRLERQAIDHSGNRSEPFSPPCRVRRLEWYTGHRYAALRLVKRCSMALSRTGRSSPGRSIRYVSGQSELRADRAEINRLYAALD
jgi:hypothetical protein